MNEGEKEKLFSEALERIEAENISFFYNLPIPYNKLTVHVTLMRTIPQGGIDVVFRTDYLTIKIRQEVRLAFSILWP